MNDTGSDNALLIRPEQASDADAIREIHTLAFPTRVEAKLVERLRADNAGYASLVACKQSTVIGHALFTHAQVLRGGQRVGIGALGPLAVLPAHQRTGIGAALVRTGLASSAELRLPAVIVLGDPNFYGRFGFSRADAWEIRCELRVPPEAFMIWWSTAPKRGPALAKYHPAFGQLED